MSPNFIPDFVGRDDESERIGGFFDEYIGVGVERKFEDFGEDVRESAEIFFPCVGLREGRSDVVSKGDVSCFRRWMNLHGEIGEEKNPNDEIEV